MYIGSADLMPRNLDRRIEVLAPILDPVLKKRILEEILLVHLADNVKTYELGPDGLYRKNQEEGQKKVDSQMAMLERDRDFNTPVPGLSET
jgi:polyphosphate kinase